jgi:peptidoglycan/LPS O-acetylase OafA/YrhL
VSEVRRGLRCREYRLAQAGELWFSVGASSLIFSWAINRGKSVSQHFVLAQHRPEGKCRKDVLASRYNPEVTVGLQGVRPSVHHLAVLDGIRGAAILLVLLHHLHFAVPEISHVLYAIRTLMYAGWSGVDLFFVLSGFLITGILIDTSEADNYFTSFYARRFLRILPLYYLVLTATLSVEAVLHKPWIRPLLPPRHDWPYYFVYLNNWWILLRDTWHPSAIGHFWSLAIEEQFYLMWPLCIWLVPRRYIGAVCLSGVVVALALRYGLVQNVGPSIAIFQNTLTRLDALLAGALCALVARNRSLLTRVRPFLLITAVVSISATYIIALQKGELDPSIGAFWQSLGLSLLAIGFGAFVLWGYASEGRSLLHRIFRAKALTKLGKYSYGIYVYHVPMIVIWVRIFGERFSQRRDFSLGLLFMAVVSASSILVAVLSYELFERRFLLLKKRYEPRFCEHPTNQLV